MAAANSVQIPPIRTNLDDPDVAGQTAKEWYLYWKRSGDRINVLNRMIASGTHADRPDPQDAPDGAIYVENDREVIYQNQNGAWHYLAGTMWGTLSPDQRPTGLGPFDGGFDFRGTDQAREFIWSQTAWVEVTPVQYGSHSGRPPAGSVATGVLYVEWDRGAIYQMQMSGTTPVWQYLAGTMYGTLVPDQRPTDLGAHDVGFTFRTSVAPPREFLWSGGMWVEVTPSQTPWTSAIDGAGFPLNNAGHVGIGMTPVYPLDVSGYAGAGYTGGCARFSAASNISESGIHIVNTGTNGRDYFLFSTGYISGQGLGSFIIADSTAGAVRLCIGPGPNIGIGMTAASYWLQLPVDSAAKPGTATWSVVSDGRVKEKVEPVTDDSLAILAALNWVRYEYNGQGRTPRGMKAIGLSAQELHAHLPDAVRGNKARLNESDASETEVLAIDYHHILVHAARAIQQLHAEVEKLKAKLDLL